MDIGKNKDDLSIIEKKRGESLNAWMLYPIFTVFKAKSSQLAC